MADEKYTPIKKYAFPAGECGGEIRITIPVLGRFVDWASWYQGRWVTWIEGSPAPLSNVIAWCKPIEPYKGVTE